MVTDLHAGDSLANTLNYACGLVSKNRWEYAFRILAAPRVNVRMAQCDGGVLDADFAFLGRSYANLAYVEGLVGFPSNRCEADDLLGHLDGTFAPYSAPTTVPVRAYRGI